MEESRRRRAVLVLFGVALGLGAVELGWRAFVVVRYAYGQAGTLGPRQSANTVAETSERTYCRYDPLLGWSPLPNARSRWTSPGAPAITIDAQGFRGSASYGVPKPSAIRRVAVLGDSFVFGVSVGDDEAFPAALGRLLGKKTEVVNLGVTGYGIDQAVLRLERDALPLKPDVVVFALILDDLRRAHAMLGGFGYGKPRFVLDGGQLKLLGVPPTRPLAPGRPYASARPDWTETLRLFFGLHPVSLDALKESLGSYAGYLEFSPLYAALFRRLKEDCRAAGAGLLVVLIPEDADYMGFPASPLRPKLARFLRGEGIAMLDLFPSPGEKSPGFIGNHPDPPQHERIARAIRAELRRRAIL